MHSFQPSRGRILLEVFCALAVVASMVGAWRQTHATALLVAAGAAGLLAMIRLFDLVREQPAVVEEPQRIAFEPEPQPVAAEELATDLTARKVEAALAPEVASNEPDAKEPDGKEPARRSSAGRRKGGARKGNGRRTSAPKAAEIIEFVPAEDSIAELPAERVTPLHVEAPDATEPTAREEAEMPLAEPPAEPTHVPHAPLFEPDPFVRMPRQAFGRRGRI